MVLAKRFGLFKTTLDIRSRPSMLASGFASSSIRSP